MKVLVLGSTGRTGQLIARQALEQGHEVTAFARNRSRLPLSHERLTIIEGDAQDRNQILKALEGQDAVLSALGAGKSLSSHNLITNAVRVLIPSMDTANVKRLIFLSAFGVGETFSQANLFQKIIFRTFLRNIYADKSTSEEIIRGSKLDWTLVYPVLLTDAPGTGTYIAAEQLRMKGIPKVPRADVAAFMIRQLSDNRFLQKTAVIIS